MEKHSVAVIVTSRSNKEQLVRCLEFIYSQDYSGSKEIIVVDNGSHDNSVFFVTSRYPQVKVIRNDVNIGIGAAINQGLAASDSTYVAVVHQDVELENNWLSTLIPGLDSDPKNGAACSLITYRRSKGIHLELESAGIGFRDGIPIRIGEGADLKSPQLENARKVLGAPGAAALYKREMLEKIKLNGECFDEDLFALYEDYDIALRAHLHNYNTIFMPGTKAMHKRGILREKDKDGQIEREILEVCNPLLMLTKCVPLHIFDSRKAPFKRAFRIRYWALTKQLGLGIAIRTWFHYRKTKGIMIKKQRALFENLDKDYKAYEWEVFGKL